MLLVSRGIFMCMHIPECRGIYILGRIWWPTALILVLKRKRKADL